MSALPIITTDRRTLLPQRRECDRKFAAEHYQAQAQMAEQAKRIAELQREVKALRDRHGEYITHACAVLSGNVVSPAGIKRVLSSLGGCYVDWLELAGRPTNARALADDPALTLLDNAADAFDAMGDDELNAERVAAALREREVAEADWS